MAQVAEMGADLMHAPGVQKDLGECEEPALHAAQMAHRCKLSACKLAVIDDNAPLHAPRTRHPQRRIQHLRLLRDAANTEANVPLAYPARCKRKLELVECTVASSAKHQARGVAIQPVHEPVLGVLVPGYWPIPSNCGGQPRMQLRALGSSSPLHLLW
eukprot:CAMPEP_0179107768 /NCGR_PEP_ID=MMETSP0796-20121207/50170_1 /TAXON_ID=73915 /ORGANISM="Pyrodinium bahamense, Strain pbaha01" /LENGTH=157 /DNA_ID=CAMNT_0020805829 /DNA_START=295 /DNA_END=768 /DNA_ORIENTATION=-